jgi:hypothetical protein
MSEFARELAPDMLVEHCRTLGVPLNGVRKADGAQGVVVGSGRWEGDEYYEREIRPYAEKVLAFCDSFRIYDSVEPLFVVLSIERTQAILRLAEKARGGVFYFWGHSYEMYQYDALWNRMDETLRYIADDPEAEWIDVVDLARRLPPAPPASNP